MDRTRPACGQLTHIHTTPHRPPLQTQSPRSEQDCAQAQHCSSQTNRAESQETTEPVVDCVMGMYATIFDPDTSILTYTRVDHDAFNTLRPYLTHKVEAKLDGVSRRIDLSVKGKVPLESQIYEVTLNESEGSTELTGELQFVNGVGLLLPSSNLNLKFSTAYTITSIVGVVPSSSESNAITITAEAWIFHLEKTPSFLSFTTPDQPPTLLASTAHLTDTSQPFAFVILLFDQEVSESYDIVVEEEGRDVTITVAVVGTSIEGESENFRVVGEDRILTHDTTYTIKSVVPTEGSATATTVWMNKTVTFHIPKSSFVAPGKDDKKALSPETKKLLSWLLPLVGCLLIALVLAIIVIVLLRRRQQKSAEPAQNEMEPQEPLEVEKVEEFGVDCSNGVIRTDDNHASSLNSDKENRPENDTMQQDPSQLGEVMACSGDFELSTARMDSTLYIATTFQARKKVGEDKAIVRSISKAFELLAEEEDTASDSIDDNQSNNPAPSKTNQTGGTPFMIRGVSTKSADMAPSTSAQGVQFHVPRLLHSPVMMSWGDNNRDITKQKNSSIWGRYVAVDFKENGGISDRNRAESSQHLYK
ncbi:hypothetical protein BLNAU_1923 [Blattamonas nauphoetae]|uniref:Uncharacterized protein n=1 Tax=Blattamonas nauphoetae TaxID=2049346 RepID=A0ABQ9YGX0_9EUKA|nr:hypothetical protein BLNAU_1923 [Blattamonas nauphoetae]